MMYTVDIDTGGTFTDGFFSDGKRLTWVKVDTTEHDLTIAFNNCLEEGSKELGFENVTDFLDQVDIIRWSSTIASNVLAQKTGPRLGLFVLKGNEDTLYSSTNNDPAIGFLIERANVIGLSQPINTSEVLREVKAHLERGVRRICLSLKGSFYDNKDELQVRKIVEDQYPEHYLGSIPVLAGEDICKHPDDMTRTHAALLNAYVHGPMAVSLFKLEDELRERDYIRPLLIGHISGGVARVSKTTPINTIESGPIFGIHGGAYFAEVYKLKKVISLDVGGTTSKIGLVLDGKPASSSSNAIFNIPVNIPLIDLQSVASGGGTVARVGDGSDSRIKFGPKSMGSYPGPACYDLGGSEATLTDALLVLGYYDPDYYAGGTRRLNIAKAESAIQERVQKPLDTGLNEAAYGILDQALNMIVDKAKTLFKRKAIDPKGFTLFAFGGNGGVLGCSVAERIGIDRVYVFSVGSIFSAFGSSTADISHDYEYAPFVSLQDVGKLQRIFSDLRDEALKDMKGEGLDLAKVEISLDLAISDGQNPSTPIEAGHVGSVTKEEVERIGELFDKIAPRDHGRVKRVVELLRLKARYPAPRHKPAVFRGNKPDSDGSIKGERKVFWKDKPVSTSIYDWNLLKSGNIVKGPAVIEAKDSSYMLPTGWTLKVDKYKNGLITRKG
jgi:N-methylhydantoinase A/oxoprolinase/acetone carboxylase beta subunit